MAGDPLAPVFEPEQFAESIRTDVTRTCWVLAVVSEPDVPATLVDALLRARRDARGVSGITMPEISTRWPTWLARSSPCSMYDELPDAPTLAALDEAPGALVAPADDVSPAVAFESMNDGPNALAVRAERDVPVVDVDPAAPVPVVPTAVACSPGVMQPTSLICWGSFAAVCDCAVDRRDVRVVERVVSVVLPVVVVVVRPDGPDEVRPAGSADCPGDGLWVAPLLVLCAPTIAVKPISTAMTAESPARFIGCLLLVLPER